LLLLFVVVASICARYNDTTTTLATFCVRLQTVGLKCFTDVIKVSFLICMSIYKRNVVVVVAVSLYSYSA